MEEQILTTPTQELNSFIDMEVVRGSTFSLLLRILSDSNDDTSLANLTGSTSVFLVKKNRRDRDSQALFTKQVVDSIQTYDGVEYNAQVDFTSADTLNLLFETIYCGCKTTLQSGQVINSGVIEIKILQSATDI